MIPRARPRFDRGAVVALLFVALFFGVLPVFGKLALREITPLVLVACRVVFGALFLSLAARFLTPEQARLTARDRGTLFVLSILGIVANQLLYVLGLARTTASDVALLANTIPIFTVIIGVLSGREWPGLRRAAGVPVALAGTLLLLNLHNLDFHDPTLVGNLLIVVNCLSYSLFLVASRDILAKRSSLGVTAAIFRYGVIPVVLVALPDLRRLHPSQLSGRTVLALAAIVVFPTVLAYALTAWALARTDASTTAVFIYAQPLVTWTLAWAVLGERPGPRFVAAAALILTGLGLATWPGRSATSTAASSAPS